MKVKVKFHGVIRDVTRAATVEMDLPDDASVMGLLDHLAARFGASFSARVLDESVGIKSYVKLFVNGDEIANGAAPETPLLAGKVPAEVMVYVMPAMVGGGIMGA